MMQLVAGVAVSEVGSSGGLHPGQQQGQGGLSHLGLGGDITGHNSVGLNGGLSLSTLVSGHYSASNMSTAAGGFPSPAGSLGQPSAAPGSTAPLFVPSSHASGPAPYGGVAPQGSAPGGAVSQSRGPTGVPSWSSQGDCGMGYSSASYHPPGPWSRSPADTPGALTHPGSFPPFMHAGAELASWASGAGYCGHQPPTTAGLLPAATQQYVAAAAAACRNTAAYGKCASPPCSQNSL